MYARVMANMESFFTKKMNEVKGYVAKESIGICPNLEEIMEYETFFLFRRDST